MRSVLEELYYGNINPGNAFFDQNSDFGKAMKRLSAHEAALNEMLDEPAKSIFSDFLNAHMEINSLTAINKFSYGFKLGMLLAAHVFSNQDDLTENYE
ncbi:MAG: hypothetical protein FWG94_08375 [Oscillospiraceae bacterium]|nr:hypothetical protein [Oscillospiraceae bacterium]